MSGIPMPVLPSIELRPVSLRRFAVPYHQALCRNCTWVSFDYATKEEAEEAGDLHAERCCTYLNGELALTVDVTPVPAQDLSFGARILLKDLRTLQVENVEVFDDEVMVTYNLDDRSEILMLPLDHPVKVVS